MKPRKIKVFRTDSQSLNITGGKSANEFLFTSAEYDDQGRLISSSHYNQSGMKIEETINAFDDNGRIIEENYSNHLENQTQKRTVTYENNGLRMIERDHFSDGSDSKTITLLNEEKHIEKIERMDDGLSVNETEFFEYDPSMNLLSHKRLDENNEILEQILCSYGENGKITNEKQFQGEALMNDIDYIYDDKNRLSAKETYADDYLEGEEKYEYNEAGQPVKITIEEGGNIISISEFFYDAEGRTIREIGNYLRIGRAIKIERTFEEGSNLVAAESRMDSYSNDPNYRLRYEYEY